jgi:RHS repeat-associated protein
MAKRVSKAATYTEFTYGPDRARYKQYVFRSGTNTETTHYVGGLLEKLTKVSAGVTTTEHTHYVRAGDSVITMVMRKKVGAAAPTGLFGKYPHRDHLGSVVATTDAGGALTERSGFDPWGKRTSFDTWAAPAPGTFVTPWSGAGGTANPAVTHKRGYTGHEQVEEFGFIHMNGRIYDPEIGKFLSADPTMQFPESTQGFNRYAYAGNNPLTNVDPSGFDFWKSVRKGLGFAIMIASIWFPPATFLAAAVNGFMTTLLISGNFKMALIGGFAAGLTFGIGSHFADKFTNLAKLGKAFLEGLVGGAASALAGGRFKAGFLGAAAGSLSGSYLDKHLSSVPGIRTAQVAVLGGTVSEIGGGRFANGAITAAFADLFNAQAHGVLAEKSREWWRKLFGENQAQHALGVAQTVKKLERQGMTILGTNVATTIGGSGQVRYYDIVYFDPSDGRNWGVEVKTTRTGNLNIVDSQMRFDVEALRSGAITNAGVRIQSIRYEGYCFGCSVGPGGTLWKTYGLARMAVEAGVVFDAARTPLGATSTPLSD